MSENEAIGMIAGNGIYPAIFAHGARSAGVKRIVSAAFEGETELVIEEISDAVSWMRVGQFGWTDWAEKFVRFTAWHANAGNAR